MLVLVLVIVTKVSLTAGYHQPLLKFKCPNSALYVYWTATYQYKFISCSEFFRNFSRGMAPSWRHCSWYTQDESDVISSYHIHARCFPAMMWGKLWEWEICLLLWRHFLCKIVTTRTFKPTYSILFELRDKFAPFNFTQYAVLPHNIEIVMWSQITVTSLRDM